MVRSPGDAVNIPRAGPRPIEQDVIHMNIGDREFKNIDQERSNAILWANNCSENDNTNADGSGETTSLFNPNGSIEGMDYPKAEKDICLNEHIGDGENISSGRGGGTLPVPSFKEETQNEPEQANNHSGTARTSKTNIDGGGADGGGMVIVDKVIERFNEATRLSLKESSRRAYLWCFKAFAEDMGLKRYSRKQLAGPTGKRLILTWLPMRRPKPGIKASGTGMRFRLGALKPVWTYGLGIPWPIDNKRDLGRSLPKSKPKQSPNDNLIKQWRDAMIHEPDIFVRLHWLFVAHFGLRPSHVFNLKWRNVQYDDLGRPRSIIAHGQEEGFKTQATVAVKLPDEVRDALMEWMNTPCVDRRPEKVILPLRIRADKRKGSPRKPGELDYDLPSGRIGYTRFKKTWNEMEAKWKLPHLTPKDLRHWVATTCRKAGLSKQATAYMMGHDLTSGSSMRDWYDNPEIQDILSEQSEVLPYGPLGTLDPPKVELLGTIPPEAIRLLRDFLDGKVHPTDMVSRLLDVKASAIDMPIVD